MGLWDGQHQNNNSSSNNDGRGDSSSNSNNDDRGGSRRVVKIDDKDKRLKFDSYIKQLSKSSNIKYDHDDNDADDDNNCDKYDDVNNNYIISNITSKKPFIESVGIIQKAIDSEMSAADEVVSKMRALRTGLGINMLIQLILIYLSLIHLYRI